MFFECKVAIATQRNFAIDLYAMEKLLIFMEFKLKGDKNR